MVVDPSTMRRFAALFFAFLLLGLAPRVSAQESFRLAGPDREPTAEEMDQARQLFVQGAQEAEVGRWADALESFRLSYRLSGQAVSLYNAGLTLRSLGRFRDARSVFDHITEDHPDASEQIVEETRNYRIEVASRIARLTLLELPEVPELQLRLDGALTPDGGDRPLELEVDPGSHTLRVMLEGYEPFLWEGTIDDGSETTVLIDLHERSGGGVGRKWWFWTIIGVVVVGGAVTAGVLLSQQPFEPQGDVVIEL